MQNPIVSTEIKFFLKLIFNFIVGYLVANGYMDPGVQDKLVIQLVEFTGYLITAIAAAIGLFGLFKDALHLHSKTSQQTKPITNALKEQPANKQQVLSPSQDAGVPPVENNQTVQNTSPTGGQTP